MHRVPQAPCICMCQPVKVTSKEMHLCIGGLHTARMNTRTHVHTLSPNAHMNTYVHTCLHCNCTHVHTQFYAYTRPTSSTQTQHSRIQQSPTKHSLCKATNVYMCLCTILTCPELASSNCFRFVESSRARPKSDSTQSP